MNRFRLGLVLWGLGLACLGLAYPAQAQTKKLPSAGPTRSYTPQALPPGSIVPGQPPTAVSKSGSATTRRPSTDSGEALWIWAANAPKENVPYGACFFRKSFDVRDVELAMVQITCDDQYEFYINGQRVGGGNDWRLAQAYDIQKFLVKGRNVIAVKGENTSGTTAGLVATIAMRLRDKTDVSFPTDTSWRTSTAEAAGWEQPRFDDRNWGLARSFGEFGSAEPWGDRVTAADGKQSKRFTIAPDFRVERLVASEAFGSLIAMTFNEFGEIVASREGGPIILVADQDNDGVPETITTFCEKVTSCQGLLALNGDVFAVGQGPQGSGLYRLIDEDQDGKADQVKLLFNFERSDLGEHGPHGLTLGPDGLIYLMLGNHDHVKMPAHPASPLRQGYEGDLFSQKYEDPGGHAIGIKSPCGTVVRTDPDGSFVETVAGGLRNAYDLTFDTRGELFTYDSDMEADIGLPWYRPTRVLHVVPGGEYGSRSGWSVWPNYWVDNVPPVLETDRGSPTGLEVYDHHAYPAQYRGALFLADWSQGRILAVRLRQRNGTYEARSEVFIEGRPLNVTDLAVGPDGWLYFSTGGRGTDGGIYRIVWKGERPKIPATTGLVKAIRQPQLTAAYSRQNIAMIQQELGDQWDPQLREFARSQQHPPEERARALELMQLFGSEIEPNFLIELAEDKSPLVRAKVAFLLGTQPHKDASATLVKLLKDTDATVRRLACEAATRGGYVLDTDALVEALGDPHRFVAWSARRAIEARPKESWKALVLESKKPRVFLVGSTALLTAAPDRETALEIVRLAQKWLQTYLSDDDFVDLLRVVELAIIRGELKSADLPTLGPQLAEEYPAGDYRMNRELVRLIVFLQETSALGRMFQELSGTLPDREKLHIALHLRFLDQGWTPQQRMSLVSYLEKAQQLPGGNSMAGYIESIRRDFASKLTKVEQTLVLNQALKYPGAALSVLANFEEPPNDQLANQLIDIDRQLPELQVPAAKKLQAGIVAMLALNGSQDSLQYLREVYESTPDRRPDLAMGLAQAPEENWDFLVRAIPTLENGAAQETLMQLAKVNRKPEKPEAIRQVIIAGVRMGANGGPLAFALLDKWTGEQPAQAGTAIDQVGLAWQAWFADKYPNEPPATLPVESHESKWNYQQLLKYLTGDATQGKLPGDAQHGASVFVKAQCIKCHKFQGQGEAIGPDLSSLRQRFQRKEILESILFPSQVISDQYASKTVTTTNGLTYTGMLARVSNGSVIVLQPSGEKVTLREDQIDDIAPSKKSSMPEGLLNTLSIDEIGDLFAFLTARGGAPTTANKPRPEGAR